MPTHHCNEIARNMVGMCQEMGLDGHKVISDSIGDGSLHDVRDKLEEWTIVVGQPQHQPAVIGGTWALIVVHRPMVPPAIMYGGIMRYPNLLLRGSAPWKGGTVRICSQS